MIYMEDFFGYLKREKRMAPNTLEAYKRDVLEFYTFEEGKGTKDPTQVSNTEVVSFLLKLKNEGKSAATVNRKLASIRAFFNYLFEKEVISVNPTNNIKSPKIKRKELEYLTINEVESLLTLPDDSPRGIRDKAILELLYATGIRVSELIEADVEDVNLRMGFITCAGEQSKARIIPIGRPARAAVEEYVYEERTKLIKGREDETALFVNYYGGRITRQGMWKILKEYGEKAGLNHKLTPNIIRNSFAVHMIQNGADLKSLQELLGHEDISATQIYLSVTKNRIKDVYDKTHPRA
ncbi:MAG: site-specific tyrosine recombinase [Anaerovoracaceae bacterium]